METIQKLRNIDIVRFLAVKTIHKLRNIDIVQFFAMETIHKLRYSSVFCHGNNTQT